MIVLGTGVEDESVLGTGVEDDESVLGTDVDVDCLKLRIRAHSLLRDLPLSFLAATFFGNHGKLKSKDKKKLIFCSQGKYTSLHT